MYKCTPISKKKLKELALLFRKEFEVEEVMFPVLDVIEKIYFDGLINMQIIEDFSQMLSENELALYDLSSNTMYIKECVYKEAINNVGRYRFTLAHELSHYLLLNVLKFEVKETNEEIKVYEDPEWQANYLAGELLAPEDKTLGYTVSDYMNKCLLSEECAIVLWDKRRK